MESSGVAENGVYILLLLVSPSQQRSNLNECIDIFIQLIPYVAG